MQSALVVDIAATRRPEETALEKMLDDLRLENPSIIDLRPLKRESGYALSISSLIASETDGPRSAFLLQKSAERAAARRQPGLLVPGGAPLGNSVQPSLKLDLRVVEQPIENYVSPVTRIVNSALRLFDRAPNPTRRLSALARSLRSPTETNHVRASLGSDVRTISVVAVIASPVAGTNSANDAVQARLTTLLGADSDKVNQARAFYDRIEKFAAVQRITVAHPVLAAAYAPLRYDYMSGYLWMFVMGSVGIALTLAFGRLEKKGVIHKRGVEEALAS